jgi:hypothetical protein
VAGSGGSAGQIDLDLGLNFGEFQRQLAGIAGQATNMVGGAFKKLGGIVAAAFAVNSLIGFGREAINLASDLQEVQNVVEVTFGAMAQDINNFSKTALDEFGLSELAAKKYASTMGAMLKSSGLTGAAVRDMSLDMTRLSADMASFYNLSTDMAFDKIRAGISGETEPLKQLGINMSVANMEAYALSKGIQKSYEKMTQAEQTLLRYNYLLSVSGDAQGDFVRNGDSWANQLRVLTERWRIFQGTMGAAFINILTPTIRWINILIQKLQVAAEYFKAFSEVLFGDATGGAAGAAAAISDVGDASADMASGVKKAGKKVKGSLAGFDQLNTITQKTADSMDDISALGGNMGGLGGPIDVGTLDIDTDPIKAKVEGVVNGFKTSFNSVWTDVRRGWDNLKTVFKFSPFASAFEKLKEPFKVSFSNIFTGLSDMGTVLWNDVVNGLGGSLITTLSNWFTTNSGAIRDSLATNLGNIFNGAFQMGNFFSSLSEVMGQSIREATPSIVAAFEGLADAAFAVFDTRLYIVTDVFNRIWTFIAGWVEEHKEPLKEAFKGLFTGITDTADLFSGVIKDVFGSIKEFWEQWGKDILDVVLKPLSTLGDMILTTWNKHITPVWEELLGWLNKIWDESLSGLVDEVLGFVGRIAEVFGLLWDLAEPGLKSSWDNMMNFFRVGFNMLLDIVGPIVQGIIDIVKSIIKTLNGVIDFLVGTFTGDWERAWEGIKKTFVGIWDGIKAVFKMVFNVALGVVEGFINAAIAIINTFIRALNLAVQAVNKIPGVNIGELGTIPDVKIPKLAKGGLAYGPTLAMVGDNPGAHADPEVVSPLSKLQDMIGSAGDKDVVRLLQVLIDSVDRLASRPNSIEMNGTQLAYATNRYSDRLDRRGR